MEFTIAKREFQQALKLVCGIIPRRTTMPILGHILIRAFDGKIHLASSDLEIEASTAIEISDIRQEGTITCPGLTLLEIVNKLDNPSLSISASDRGVKIDSLQSHYMLPTLPVDDFPQTLDEALPEQFSLETKALRSAFDRTLPFASNDDQRNYLNGIFLHTTDQNLAFVSTDAHRLVRHQIEKNQQIHPISGVIIPRRAAALVRGILDGQACENILIALSDNKIRFAIGSDIYLIAKLVEGNYPPYEKVIPKDNPNCLSISRSEMLAAVERIMIVLSERSRKIDLHASSTQLHLRASSNFSGEADENLACRFNLENFSVLYNGQYLKDILDNMISDSIQFFWDDPKSPVLIKAEDSDQTLYVLTPLRVS